MATSVFLDVGAHEGQTLEVATKPVYGFDDIYAFEPMPAQYKTLCERFPRVEVCNYGLADHTGLMPVYGDNVEMEASLYPDKQDVDPDVVTTCKMVEASEFFKLHIDEDDWVIVKLNCEGAEIQILNNLLDSGELWKVDNVMVDFDVRRIPRMAREEQKLLDRFKAEGFDRYIEREYVMLGDTHAERTACWLDGLA